MMTLRQFEAMPATIPAATGWSLADLAEARGRQELYTRQSPQRLKTLREHAIIESAVSSNRIEGVEVDRRRVGTIIFGRAALRDRDEEEVRGYRDALRLIHGKGQALSVSPATILRLHRLCRAGVGDAGRLKTRDGDIIEKHPDGRVRVRFKTVAAGKTPLYLKSLTTGWQQGLKERWVHPLILLAGFNLDFLCIHPFRDGNGRVSRLLLLLQCYHLGYEAGRYISLERIIEQNKERYYETLERSSQGWHEGRHDPWPYVNYLLFVLREAYKEFESRLGRAAGPRGAKTQMVTDAINATVGPVTVSELLRACPGVGIDLVRRTLKRLQAQGIVRCVVRGRNARWERVEAGN
jgi:hypothetical protein